MALRQTTRTRSHTGAARSAGTSHRRIPRSAQPAEGIRTLRQGTPCRLRVPATEAQRLRSLLLSDEVGLIGSQDIRKLVTILEDVYPVQRQRHSHWQPLLMGMGIGLMIIIGILLVG